MSATFDSHRPDSNAAATPAGRHSRTAIDRRLPVRTGITAIVTAALLAACSETGTTRATPAITPQGPYVALGDSYTSGAGIPDQTGAPAGCRRSSNDYPTLVARSLRLSPPEIRDVSCQGATIADLSTTQDTGDGTNQAQLTALTPDTGLVTLGIGGNDVDFGTTLTRCAAIDLAPSSIGGITSNLAPCQSYYTAHGKDQIQNKIEIAARHLDDALTQIRNRAPHARVFVIGYPALFPPGGAACAHSLRITSGDVTFLNKKEVQLNGMLKQHAEAAGATYVDTYTPSLGHDACSDPATRWIEPLVPASPAAPLHPNARGAHGMADSIVHIVSATAGP